MARCQLAPWQFWKLQAETLGTSTAAGCNRRRGYACSFGPRSLALEAEAALLGRGFSGRDGPAASGASALQPSKNAILRIARVRAYSSKVRVADNRTLAAVCA